MSYGICRVCGLVITEDDHETSHTDPLDPLAEVHEDCCDATYCGGDKEVAP